MIWQAMQSTPSDTAYWEAMKHRHLIAAYVVTWVIQLSYAGWVARRWFAAGK
jgi:hypothetical protein